MAGSGARTILLVEDDLTLQRLFADRLGLEGFVVLTADCVEAALRVSRQYPEPLDLVIVDVFLPRTIAIRPPASAESRPSQPSGISLAQQIRLARPEARVLYITGHAEHEMQRLGVFQDPWPLLPKPFPPDVLVETVWHVLRRDYPPLLQ